MNNTDKYKELLEAEVKELDKAMSQIGKETDELTGDWTANPTAEQSNNEDDLADQAEELETNQGILDTLEERMQEVNSALYHIEEGTYGKCMMCGEEIEPRRLEADPAATTCVAHMTE